MINAQRNNSDLPIFRQVTDPDLLVEYPPTQYSHGLVSTALGLRVPLTKTIEVRCTARVAPAWKEGSEAVVGNNLITDSKEAMLLGKLLIGLEFSHYSV